MSCVRVTGESSDSGESHVPCDGERLSAALCAEVGVRAAGVVAAVYVGCRLCL